MSPPECSATTRLSHVTYFFWYRDLRGMGEAEVTLSLGPFLCLVIMVTKPDVRAFFPSLEGSEN